MDGIWGNVCIRGNIANSRGLFLRTTEMESGDWSAFQDSDILQSVTSDGQIYNLLKDNTHDPGAQKNGENIKVNVNKTVLNERGI